MKTKQKRNRKATRRDYSKYTFHGTEYGKGPLVRAVVREYLEKHPKTTVHELKEIFPKKEVHSTFEVVESVRRASKGRFFLNRSDLIKAADSKIAVTSQWSKNNIDSFIEFVRKNLHMKIQLAA